MNMVFIKKYWNRKTKISLIILMHCALIIFIYNFTKNIYLPVRLTSSQPPIIGGIYSDGSATAYFTIKNYTNKEQKVSFIVYQHNDLTGEDQLFNIEHVNFFLDVGLYDEIKDGIVKIPGGESRSLYIEARAKDRSNILTSRGAPNVEVVTFGGPIESGNASAEETVEQNSESCSKQPVEISALVEDFMNNGHDNQIFYGTWEIKEWVTPDGIVPSSYSGFDANGNFLGPDFDDLLGTKITFQEDYVEYNGIKHAYAYKPKAYSYALPPPDNVLGYYDVETLGLQGCYYSTVEYLLSDNYMIKDTVEGRENKVYISDFYILYLKDADTMYISQGVYDFLLVRVKW